jgi:hypothetical protein
MEKRVIGCKIGTSGFEERACFFCPCYRSSIIDNGKACVDFRKRFGAILMYR